MKRILHVVISIAVFGCLFTVQAQNGFAIWAKKGGCERELQYTEITDGNKIGETKLVCPKGPGADIWPVISYDGEWIAWCRSPSAFKGKYGQCDYHNFGIWDLYVARIDFGNTLPAEPIKVAKGYLPNWAMDENAKTPGKPKALYYTKYDDQTIQKTIINPDGTFTPPVENSRCPKKVQGSGAHTQGSPDGKFILYRPGGIHCYSVELKKNIGSTGKGCHPTWGPRSKYFIRSKNGAFYNTGTSVKKLGSAGVGAYFQGFSNDAYYDEGKLWVIGPIGGGQNNEGSVQFREVGISNDGAWKLGAPTEVGRGSSSDIHMFPKDFDPKNPPKTDDSPTNTIYRDISENRISFTTQIKTTATGFNLVIYSMGQAGKTAELFDIQGKRIGFIKMSGSMQNIMPLNNIVNGRYILKISGDNAATLKSIFISR